MYVDFGGGEGFWAGSLLNMYSGLGYMYYSENAAPFVFNYPLATRSPIREYEPQYELKWIAGEGNFSDNMSITATVMRNNEEFAGNWIELAVFSGEECRGSDLMRYDEVMDKYVGYLTVYGESNEELTFKVFNHANGLEYAGKNVPLPFVANAIIGNPARPYMIDLGADGTTGIDDGYNTSQKIVIHPNPARDELRITIYDLSPSKFEGVDGADGRGSLFEIYDIMGKLVKSHTSYLAPHTTIDVSDLAQGVYLLKVMLPDEIVMLKFVKE